MIKLSHDSYLQGALDFLKAASIDSDVSRTALEVLSKEASLEQELHLREKLHRAAEADLRDALKRANKLKGKALGLGGLAALGLGYAGYDQLSDSGVPSLFAETPPSAP